MTTRRQTGTNPRAQGTNPRAKGTNPRAVTLDDLARIETKLDQAIAILRQLTAQPSGRTDQPQAAHDPERGMFLPGTGWLGGNTSPASDDPDDDVYVLADQDNP